MTAFLLKYKRTIIFWLVFLMIIVYFAPRQNSFYLEDDIKTFKRNHLTPILIWSGAVITTVVFFLVLAKTKSFKQSGLSFLYVSVSIAFFVFIFQDLFLAAALFINRQFKQGVLQKEYVVRYMAGTDRTKDNFIPYDLSTNHLSIDRKLINKLYNSELKQNDTVTLQFGKGLFGVAFQSEAFDDK